MKFITGSSEKIKEFKRINPSITPGVAKVSPKEIKSQDTIMVAVYKVIDMFKQNNFNEEIMIEDTALEVEGAEIGTDIKYLVEQLDNLKGKNAKWIVTIATTNGEKVEVFQGVIKGRIDSKRGTKGFAFDKYFVPNYSTKTLSQLEEEDQKDFYSARKEAIIAFQNKNSVFRKKVKYIPEWTGEYQEE
jgi:XTP/dITP diphosphohydrolase